MFMVYAIAKYPNLGVKTEMESVRGLMVDEYRIYYERKPRTVVIHTIWNRRQKPDALK